MLPVKGPCPWSAGHRFRTGGLIPLQAMIDAGKYFLRKQKRSTGVPEKDILKIAVRSLGLDDIAPFDPKKKSLNI
jgi:hypothetical protein